MQKGLTFPCVEGVEYSRKEGVVTHEDQRSGSRRRRDQKEHPFLRGRRAHQPSAGTRQRIPQLLRGGRGTPAPHQAAAQAGRAAGRDPGDAGRAAHAGRGHEPAAGTSAQPPRRLGRSNRFLHAAPTGERPSGTTGCGADAGASDRTGRTGSDFCEH